MVCRELIGAVAVSFVFTSCGSDRTDAAQQLDLVGEVDKQTAVSAGKSLDSEGASAPTGDRMLTVDLIQDLLFRKNRDGWTLLTPVADVNLDKLKAGKVDLIFAAVPVDGDARKAFNVAYSELVSIVSETGGRVKLVSTMGEVDANRKQGIVSMMILLEGADGLSALSTGDLIELRNRSLTVVGLVSSKGNEIGDSFSASPGSEGLTSRGVDFVQNLREAGLAVNLTYASEETFWDVLVDQGILSMVSYSACRSLREHPRNLTDIQILALARYGGVMGVVFNPEFIHTGDASKASIDDVISHFVHVRRLGATGALAIGSDFDGILPPAGLEDVSALPLLQGRLAAAGFSDDEIRGIYGGHVRRFMDAVETRQGAAEMASTDLLRPIDLECDAVAGESSGALAASCDGQLLVTGPTLMASTRQRFRLSDMRRKPQKLEIFGVPNTPWQVEAQNLDGKILVHRSVLLDKDGRGELPMPSDRNLSRFFLFPTRPSQLSEAILWGR